jgi:hypothetical protein
MRGMATRTAHSSDILENLSGRETEPGSYAHASLAIQDSGSSERFVSSLAILQPFSF